MRIRFLEDQVYERDGPGKGPKFAKDFVLDAADVQKAIGLDEKPSPEWVEGFLNRWVQRNKAVVVDGRSPPTAPEAVEVETGAAPVKVQEPFGTAKHGGPVKGLDDGKQIVKAEPEKIEASEKTAAKK